MKVIFRVDASIQTGSGHLMRCLTLAQALDQQGFDCGFICQDLPGHLTALVQAQGFKVQLLAPDTDETTDAERCLAFLVEAVDLLVVDHYRLGESYTSRMRAKARQIMVIDDLANRKHDADLLLDQNLLPDSSERYSALVSSDCRQLLGPEYALLRPEFYQAGSAERSRLLVNFGGTDPDNLTLMALDALETLKPLSIAADIVVGQAYPQAELVRQRCAKEPLWQFHQQCDYMAKLMQSAKIMLGAGGSTHWERCYSSLPALVITVAENQRLTTRFLHSLGACIWLGDAVSQTKELLARAIMDSWNNKALLHQMASQANALVPRDAGTPAVVRAITELMRS
ncbi:UDP-2,4-diacetamido-2,4,6-trideoxy-beta-L-altropyranose hydrolase [Rheinheimera marina]|uniref:UDP-2,4-diacetamido-2,4, 6-trideoxy-beta-L-altropyranose hydrolase n=1 Tax=Rheinheimera marina TaxID=1774958 RepID=A0ABV9JRU4_9GAMM